MQSEKCSKCGAMLEKGDDGCCNRCGAKDSYKESGVAGAVTDAALTTGGSLLGGSMAAPIGGTLGGLSGLGTALVADEVLNRMRGKGITANTAQNLMTFGSLGGAALGGLTGAVTGGTLGHRLAKGTENAAKADPDKSKEEKDKESALKLAASKMSRCWEGYEPVPGKKPNSPGSCRPKKNKKKEKPLPVNGKKESQAEDPLLERIEQSTGDKGRAIAIAKSRGWVKQNGKHLELTAKGKKPAQKAKSTLQKKSAEEIIMRGACAKIAAAKHARFGFLKWLAGAPGKVVGGVGKGLEKAGPAVTSFGEGAADLTGKALGGVGRFAKNRPRAATAIGAGGSIAGAGALGAGIGYLNSDPVDEYLRQNNGLPQGYDNPAMWTGGGSANRAQNLLPWVAAYRTGRAAFDPAFNEYRQAVYDAKRNTPERIMRSARRVNTDTKDSERRFNNSRELFHMAKRRAIVEKFKNLRKTFDPSAVVQDPTDPKYQEQRKQYDTLMELLRASNDEYAPRSPRF